MLTAILIILILIIVTMFYSVFRIQKNYKLDIEKNPLYRELLYIKALLVFAAIVLVFFGWNIQENIVTDLGKDLENKASSIQDTIYKKIQDKLEVDVNNLQNYILKDFKEKVRVLSSEITKDMKAKIEQDFNTALNGFIIEVPLDTCKINITYKFKNLKDIKGNLINNGKDFENIPIVSLNYVGQPYTVIEITNRGFTVSQIAIPEDFTWGGLKPREFTEENKLIIWIINRD